MNREETLFAAAVALPTADRPAYLDRECAGDSALRRRLDELLRAHERASSLMPAAASNLGETVPAFAPRREETTGDLIGRYKLLQQIGEGGCGVVYMAEQTAPVVRRVALKVIKLGMDTKAVIARFEAERQALAMMDHPNIAKVLDAGTTDNGRPFFVMELVRGIPITKYCDENNVSTAARLSLFEQVCHAIQHAHQKGIIHRDIKPSNILVTLHDGVPVPKVIDFGIAKATQGKLTDATVFTAFEQFIGTPAYMSPEQAEMSGLDIDTRSDIYSLGVLLYELLTGRPPFDPKSFVEAGLDEMRRMIREVEPPKPSTRLNTLTVADRTTVAKLRGTQPTQLRSQLSGDLDWIVMKALEKNRMRRYESASAFAADLQRHLHNEPVTARPPSAAYLIQKLIHRHKVGFAAAAAIAVALVLGLAFSTWSFLRERAARERAVAAERQQVELRRQAETARNEEAAQRRQAEQARERAVAAEAEQAKQRAAAEAARNEEAAQRALAEEARNKEAAQRALAEAATANEARQRALAEAEEKKAVSAAAKSDQAFRFMAKMLSGVSPSVAAGRDTTLLREILDKTVKRLARLDDEPEIQVNLSTIIGLTYLDLGDTAKAGAIAGEALAKAEKLFGHDHLVTAGALTLLCGVRSQQGKYEEGEAAGLDALAILRRLPEPHDEEIGETESMLGLNQLAQGKLVAAEATFRDAIAIAGRIGDDDELPRDSLELLLASVLQKQGRLAEAGTMVSAALPTLKERLGAGHPTMAMAYLIRSNVLLAQGKYDEALTLYDEALPLLKKSLSPKHPAVITLLTNKAIIVERQGKLAEAEALDREILAAQTESLGGDHPSTINTMSFLSSVLRKEGKTADAARVDREIDASLRRTLKSPDVVDASKQASQGLSALIEGDPAKAEARLRASLAVLEKSFGADNPVLLSAQLLLAGSILFQGRAAEAEVLTRKLLDTCRLTVGEKSVFTLNAEVQLAQTLIPQGKLAEAGDLLQKSLELGKSLGTESASAPGTLVLLALVRALENQPAESAALLQRSAGLTTGLPANVQGLVSFACLVLNDAFDHNQHFAEAVILHRTIVAFESQVHGRNSTEMAKALGGLASALVRAQQFAEAETVARDALALRQKRLTPGDWLIYNAQKLVGDSLVGQKRYAEAEPLLLGAFKEMQSRPPKASEAGLRATWRQRLSEAAAALAGLYETTSQPDKAAAWQKQRDELATPEPSSA